MKLKRRKFFIYSSISLASLFLNACARKYEKLVSKGGYTPTPIPDGLINDNEINEDVLRPFLEKYRIPYDGTAKLGEITLIYVENNRRYSREFNGINLDGRIMIPIDPERNIAYLPSLS